MMVRASPEKTRRSIGPSPRAAAPARFVRRRADAAVMGRCRSAVSARRAGNNSVALHVFKPCITSFRADRFDDSSRPRQAASGGWARGLRARPQVHGGGRNPSEATRGVENREEDKRMLALLSLTEEHQMISGLLGALQTYATRLRSGATVDPADLARFSEVLHELVDYRHHEKEEGILMPLLARNGF